MKPLDDKTLANFESVSQGKTDGQTIAALIFTVAEVLEEKDVISGNDFFNCFAKKLSEEVEEN